MHIQHFILKSSLTVKLKSLSPPLSVLPSDKVIQNKKETNSYSLLRGEKKA